MIIKLTKYNVNYRFDTILPIFNLSFIDIDNIFYSRSIIAENHFPNTEITIHLFACS
jgi:hypothetical protein